MFKSVELWKEPLDIFDKMPEYKQYCEMSDFEQAFLCGMLKSVRPKKIVEIGIAAGGTTSVILNCVSMLGIDAEVYSLDLNKNFFRDESLYTGFVVDIAKKHISCEGLKHTVMTGGYAPEFLPEIGKDIDFLILDTVHRLPGELLDFLACLPYLKKGATVVLHDIALNCGSDPYSYATKLLFDVVVADKYLLEDSEKISAFPNIAAFKITDDTYKYISSCFSALTITWTAFPKAEELKLYHNFLSTLYDSKLVDIYDKAVLMQVFIACRKFKNMDMIFLNKWKKAKHVVIYGCGLWGKYIYTVAKCLGIKTDCFVISDDRPVPDSADIDIPILHLSELQLKPEECFVLVTVEKSSRSTVYEALISKGYIDMY